MYRVTIYTHYITIKPMCYYDITIDSFTLIKENLLFRSHPKILCFFFSNLARNVCMWDPRARAKLLMPPPVPVSMPQGLWVTGEGAGSLLVSPRLIHSCKGFPWP